MQRDCSSSLVAVGPSPIGSNEPKSPTVASLPDTPSQEQLLRPGHAGRHKPSDAYDVEKEKINALPEAWCRPLAITTLVAWTVATLVSLAIAPHIFDYVEAYGGFHPDKTSAATTAFHMAAKYFPSLTWLGSLQALVVLKAEDGASVKRLAVQEFEQNFLKRLLEEEPSLENYGPIVSSYYSGFPQLGFEPQEPMLAQWFMSPDETTTLVSVMPRHWNHDGNQSSANAGGGKGGGGGSSEIWAFVESLRRFAAKVSADLPGFKVLVTGNPAIWYDAAHDPGFEVVGLRVELLVLPIALLVTYVLVGSIRSLVLPVIALGVSLACSLAVSCWWAQRVEVGSDVPAVTLSFCMALGLDYSLFILSRFREECANQEPLHRVIQTVITRTGRTVVLSGSLVAIALYMMAVLPQPILSGSGLALGTTVVVCVLVHITLLPAALVVFGGFMVRSFDEEGDGPDPEVCRELMLEEEDPSSALHRTWLRLMQTIAMCPTAVVMVLLILFAPILFQATRLHVTADTFPDYDPTYQSVQGMVIIEEAGFAPGLFDPYFLVVEQANASVGFLKENGHEAVLDLCHKLNTVGEVHSMVSAAWLLTKPVSYEEAMLGVWYSPTYRKVASMLIQKDGKHALIEVHLNITGKGAGSATWAQSAKQMISQWEEEHAGYKVYLSGANSEGAEARDDVLGALPYSLSLAFVGILFIVLVSFGSILLTLRLSFAIAFTIALTFGIVVIVFQTPLLHPLFPSLARYYGVAYEVVPIGLIVSVALGLDYDMFVISRIYEYRLQGHTDVSSIVTGVSRTGGTVTGAGLIMSLAFGGLGSASKVAIQQLALILSVSVFLDTFLIRSVLVPALMLSAGPWNWWPRRMPDPIMDISLSEEMYTSVPGYKGLPQQSRFCEERSPL